MRYTNIDNVQQGELLGKNIYSSDGRVLLHEDVPLTVGLISKLRHMGVQYIYIKDKNFEDVEIEEVVSEQTKRQAMNMLTTSFQYVQTGKDVDTKEINTTIKNIIDEIMENEHILFALTDIRTEDNAIFVHSLNVCIMSVLVGIKVGMDRSKLQELAIGALFHDIGKVLPDKEIKNANPGEGDPNHHCWKGFNKLRKNKEISTLSAHIALTHHEHVDGTGEPRGLQDKDIHLLSKIVSVANYYDNLVSPIDGSKPLHPYEAGEHIMALTNKRFSHPVVWRFLRAVAFYPTGSQVILSNGKAGVVVGQNTGLPQRPIVRTFEMYRDADDYSIEEIDLAKETTIFIKKIIS